MKKLVIYFVALIIGTFGSFGVNTYIELPETEELIVTDEVFYGKGGDTQYSQTANIDLSDADISVHFIELGNKYTGDCTYIKAKGTNLDGTAYETDILIDCGSKSTSIEAVSSYLGNYVTDNKLEYVIITHAHQDHYAGFATTENVDSIFDLFECGTIIYFSNTNQKATSKTYLNFKRELNDEVVKGANAYTALQCINGEGGASSNYQIGDGITLTILNSFYYGEGAEYKSSTENDYSVCTLISTSSQNFLFTGDLEEDGEAKLVELNSLPEVDLYKAGHHGSKTSSHNVLLEEIQPKTVCVCCCAGSPEYTKTPNNQFPTQEFIDRISNYTECVYVTTLCVNYANNEFTSFNGNIVYIAKGTEHNVQCSNNNTALKDSEWFKNNRTWTNESLVKVAS